ncbi:rRNA maturation RNase YbeY [Flavobacterium lacus]|uniref:Endoribonuclease YbeY n=1 Tax=Flavobacterium lacus TaxID=1353778 RepID=A0A328X335_9FLAO|nr:rRNA maturation RNase YbeY [Flavobacterium lacus]RAR49659.1 rRNA maturation RNase YbeY [Flavobacterium lacus]
MISFNYQTDFELEDEKLFSNWISAVILSEDKGEGEISYIFCDDEYLLKINMEYLNHDTLTDIISFDYSEGNFLHGDIFISVERVQENAIHYNVSWLEELKRVMAHGVLHYCGYKDKSEADEKLMRQKEEEKMMMFHVEQ